MTQTQAHQFQKVISPNVLRIDLNTADIPEIFARFRDVVGDQHWLSRVTLIKAEIRGHPLLKEYLEGENDITLALARYSHLQKRYGKVPAQEIENRILYPAISFAAQSLSIMDQSSGQQAKRFVRRIHGAFKNPAEMRAIRLELVASTHFTKRGYSILWPEMEQTGTFDLLVQDIGTHGLEVECKVVSRDKGRKIHRREAIDFIGLIKPKLKSVGRSLQLGLAVVLTVPGRLPTTAQQRKVLSERVVQVILASQSMSFDDGTNVRLSEFPLDLGNLGPAEQPKITRELIDQVTGTRNREAMVIGNKNGGAIVFVLQSQQDDALLQTVFDTVAQSAKEQVTGTRPALYLIGLHDVASTTLLDVATQDFDPQQHPTALRIAVSKFLANGSRDHVIGVGFLSSSGLVPKQRGVVESGGTAYIFPKHESRFWHEDFSGLFSLDQ